MAALSVCFLQAFSAAQKHRAEYKSPDGALVAIVLSRKALEATAESRVEVYQRSGKLLIRANYASPDGEHGYGIARARWTPDSKYFVYSLESSGGHQAWHSPVRFFCRERNKIRSLDNARNDAVANPNFPISAPDRVTVELLFGEKEKTVSLSSLNTNPERP